MWTPTFKKYRDTLRSMCRMTTPYGCESYIWSLLPCPPHGAAPGSFFEYDNGCCLVDKHGNYLVHIPGETGNKILWTAHADTADDSPTHVNLVECGDILKTDGATILGADDKVGCAIMAMMIRAGCPGSYAFFAGEEVGCIGSGAFAETLSQHQFTHCISLDRRSTDSIVTHQCGRRTASDEWARAFSRELAIATEGGIMMSPDSTGLFTDSNELRGVASECTNISVGYWDQHTKAERCNMRFGWELCMALIGLVLDDRIPPAERSLDDDEEDLWLKPAKGTWRNRNLDSLDWDSMDEKTWLTKWEDADD